MKVKYLPVLVFLGAMSFLLSSYDNGYTNRTSGDRTGAEGTLSCGGSGCHSSTATAGITIAVELDSAGTAVTTYHPGIAYTLKLTGTNTTANNLPVYGFGLASVKLSGAGSTSARQAGTWSSSLPAGVQNSVDNNGLQIIEHSVPAQPATGTGAAGSTYVRTIGWTAPIAGTGAVKFYGVVNAANGDGNEGTADKWNGANITVTEAVAGPNGISDLSGKVEGLTIYPTVMSGNVTMAFDLKENAAVSAEMISMNGQVVRTLMTTESLSTGAVNRSYDVNGLAPGIYFVKVQIGNSYTVYKVVKQ